MNGLLILDKPIGMTSQQATSRVRRALKVKKAGHTGTLDPLATGVLPIALGEATKVIPFLVEESKAYRVTGKLGVTTDTYDSEGRVIDSADPSSIQLETLQALLPEFLGEQAQLPPAYSAIKVQGRPLYDYVRKGQEVVLHSRQVRFDVLEMKAWQSPDFTLEVLCSKGTYIRSLVHDLGQKLGCGAHVTALRRLASGPFNLARAVSLESLQTGPEEALKRSWSIEELLSSWPQLEILGPEELQRVRTGVSLRRINQVIENNGFSGKKLVLSQAGQIHALIESPARGDFAYLRVLNREESV